MRTFKTGAIRDTSSGKADYSYRHPSVEQSHAIYMMKHAILPDGSMRSMTNWWRGIPLEEGMKSLVRHVMDAQAILNGLYVYKERHNGAEYTHYLKEIPKNVPKNWTHVSLLESLHGAHFNVDVCTLSQLDTNRLKKG